MLVSYLASRLHATELLVHLAVEPFLRHLSRHVVWAWGSMVELDDAISPTSTAATCIAPTSRSNTGATVVGSDSPPFEAHVQICDELEYTAVGCEKIKRLRSHGPRQTLPDAPRIPLDPGGQVIQYCLSDLDTPSLNRLGAKISWAGAYPVVKSLSTQLVLNRRIVLTEDPPLHLLWADDILLLKPLPAYLCSHAFWESILDPANPALSTEQRAALLATARGFLRSYAHLIQHRSDFALARQTGLLASFPTTSFEDLATFLAGFADVPDESVSMRFRFGLLNLDALNFHSVLRRRRWHLNRYEHRYAAYFQRFFPVMLFMFALFSVMLSAMQVIVAARDVLRGLQTEEERAREGSDKGALGFFVWFGWEVIGWSVAFGGLLVFWWVGISAVEGWRRRGLLKRVMRKRDGEG